MASMPRKATTALVVGLGRAGRLHVDALARLRERRQRAGEVAMPSVLVTDLAGGRAGRLPAGSRWVDRGDVKRAAGERPSSAIVHVTTPPAQRVAVVAEYAALGFRRFIVEKPLALTVDEVQRLRACRDELGLAIFVVGNWVVSAVTARLIELITAPGRRLVELRVTQLKPRVERSLRAVEGETVFDVEMPHSLGLAALIAGYPLELLAASAEDLTVDGHRRPMLARGVIEAAHPNGVKTTIHSDLTSPTRQRTVVATCDDVTAVAHYPVSSHDNYGQVEVRDRQGARLLHEFVWDDSFGQMFARAYTDWWGEGELHQNFELNAAVVGLLDAARHRAASGGAGEPAGPAVPAGAPAGAGQ
jgi:predicted dehydrogenase